MSAILLQNGKQAFTDVNSRPLVGGKVYFYAPGTNTPKDTWQDSAQTVLNTNPIILDARGEASIYGSGPYRQVLRDASGVLIWDAFIPDIAETLQGAIDDIYSKSAVQVTNVAAVRLLSKLVYTKAQTLGYRSANDGGNGFYYLDPSDTTSADNGGTIIVAADGGRWKLVVNNGRVNVLQFGAYNDGGTDSAPMFQAAANASRQIFVPAGRYQLDTTVNLRGGTYLEGAGREQTVLARTINQGHTFIIGSDTDHANNFKISGFWFYKEQPYTSGTTTTIKWPVTPTSRYIQVNYGQDCDIVDNFFHNMPYAICFADTSLLRIQRNNFLGIWDTQIPGLQEGIAAIYSAQGVGYNALIDISYNHISGGYFALNRTKTIGTTTYVVNEQIGPRLGIYSETAEGLNIHHNYLGGQSQYCIATSNINISAQLKITDNFFDGGRDGTIRLISGTNPAFVLLDFQICRNGFNGQLVSPEAISSTYTGGVRSANTGLISENVFENHLTAPISLDGVAGVTVSDNRSQGYNARGGGVGNPGFSAGLLIGANALSITTDNNAYGGGTNNPMGGNNCQWGEYWLAGSTGFATNPKTNGVGLGLAGGGLIGNFGDQDLSQITDTAAGNYQMLQGQQTYIRAKTVSATSSVALPLSPYAGMTVLIKDGLGVANTFPLIITTSDGSTIDFAASQSIASSYGFARYRFNGARWNRVG
ncbi:glycosyl hydrolase family 28-related protein [Pseudomonas sp. MONT-RG-20F-20-E-7-02]|uniref:glycosyl hydrolase family 28-related protein n=1 Tax=Pseudomonas sp. MONT-RG-20F-20-E-7-02 TaxID=2914979 RepID=UPI001F5A1C63|nr:glycosyl hydrolase family 28-related protein [Pseudomonas sp. MONT-RG-20F-20-E-7-02]